jgi:hypothetical protein
MPIQTENQLQSQAETCRYDDVLVPSSVFCGASDRESEPTCRDEGVGSWIRTKFGGKYHVTRFGYRHGATPWKRFSLATAASGYLCPAGTVAVPKETCIQAPLAVMPEGSTQKRTHLVVGDWGHVSPGCAPSAADATDFAAHFNTNTNASPNAAGFPQVCMEHTEEIEITLSFDDGSTQTFGRVRSASLGAGAQQNTASPGKFG